ncbi:hypothetical protein GCM10023171_04680 [Microbacterium panaciterrae]|uniref:Lipoprotein n=1 Tax=Microbacterium panaciterrae TaxID=985759 RepID=A0ABP8P3Q0_9MICO
MRVILATVGRTRIHARPILAAIGATLALVGITGCAAGTAKADATSSAQPSVISTSPNLIPTASATETDRATCETYSDMLTILRNTDYSFHIGEIVPQERTGWYDLAFRVIGRAPSAGGGAVSEALAKLKPLRPPMDTASSTPDATSIAWNTASQALADACKAEGLPHSSQAFVGG